jgi:phosphotransferase system HPr (HPr) family protein
VFVVCAALQTAKSRHVDKQAGHTVKSMSEQSTSKEVVITNPQGLHARPAHAFVTLASQYESQIEVIKSDEVVNGKSILSILTLGASQGTKLQIKASGVDALEAVAALTELVEQGFDEAETEAS